MTLPCLLALDEPLTGGLLPGTSGFGDRLSIGLGRLLPGGGLDGLISGLGVIDAARCDPGLFGGRGGFERAGPPTCLGGIAGLESRDEGRSSSSVIDKFDWFRCGGSLLAGVLTSGRLSGSGGEGSTLEGGEPGDAERLGCAIGGGGRCERCVTGEECVE